MVLRTLSWGPYTQGMYNPKHKYMRKLGIYSYRADFLPTFINMAGLRSEGSDGQPVLAKSLIT